MEYRPAPGASLSKADAQTVGVYLEALGEFTPSDVVAAARPAESPLHKHFEWDDLAAAEKFRLGQARHLVNTITVIVTNPVTNKEEETKAFHSISIESEDEGVERRYTSIRIVSASEPRRDQVIENALRELEGWTARHRQYQEIFGVDIFAEIQKTVGRVRAKRKAKELQPQI